ncbi:MAG: hypothetical protein AAGI17_00260 [Planctomycetota bacterium]
MKLFMLLRKTIIAATAILAGAAAIGWIYSQFRYAELRQSRPVVIAQELVETSWIVAAVPEGPMVIRSVKKTRVGPDFSLDNEPSIKTEFKAVLAESKLAPMQPISEFWSYDPDRVGFALQSVRSSGGPSSSESFLAHLPWWLLTALPATPWLISTALLTRRQLRRRHRHKHGLCLTCGYNLRLPLPPSENSREGRGEGSPSSNASSVTPRSATPCPECGTLPT